MTSPNDTSFLRTLALSTDTALQRRFMVLDEPLLGNFRFGLLLEVLDKLAEDTALAYVRSFSPEARVVTAAIDNILIRHAADLTRDMILHARINHVGRTSLEVGIRVEQPGETPVHIASCFFTMVARLGTGEESTSVPIPSLEYVDNLEKQRAQKAIERREAYRKRQSASLEPPSLEEYDILNRLHRAQEEPEFSGLLADRLVTESWERMYPEQENVPKTVFGGYLVRRAYELSSICAELVAPDRPVIAAVNRINFFHPVRLGDKLHFTSRVVYTGKNTICVEAGIERISRDRSTRALSNSCLFTFVNVDRDLAHKPVPSIYPTTYAEDARFLAAHRSHPPLGRFQ
jgi:acyl-coenzyme A thioesterase 9